MLALFSGDGRAPVRVAQAPAGGQALLFEDWNGLCLVAYSGEDTGALLALDRRTGQAQAQCQFAGGGLAWAGLRDNALFTLEEDADRPVLRRRALPSLTVTEQWPLPAAVRDRALFDCCGTGRFYFTDSAGALWTGLPGEDPQPVPGVAQAEFLEITPGGTAVVWGGAQLYWGPARDPSQWRQDTLFGASPLCLLGEGTFLDGWGGLTAYGSGGLSSVEGVTGLEAPASPLHYAMDRDGNLLYPRMFLTQVVCSALDGTQLGSVPVEGELQAVCGSGLLWLDEGAYWFLPVQFYQEPEPSPTPAPTEEPEPSPTPAPTEEPEPSPTPAPTEEPEPSPTPAPTEEPEPSPTPGPTEEPEPSPTPAPTEEPEPTPTPDPTEEPEPTPTPGPTEEPKPTPTPGPTEEPEPSPSPSPTPPPTPEGIQLEGDTLLMPEGVTVEQLLGYFAPDAVYIRRADGSAVTAGRLATGMTAGPYSVVVWGDCDGTGSVSQSDLRAAQALVLEGPAAGGPYARAADLDGDGQLTTLDLVLLERLVNS